MKQSIFCVRLWLACILEESKYKNESPDGGKSMSQSMLKLQKQLGKLKKNNFTIKVCNIVMVMHF